MDVGEDGDAHVSILSHCRPSTRSDTLTGSGCAAGAWRSSLHSWPGTYLTDDGTGWHAGLDGTCQPV